MKMEKEILQILLNSFLIEMMVKRQKKSDFQESIQKYT